MTMFMPNWLMKRAKLSPDRIAVESKTEKWTFAELNERAEVTARCLDSQGIREEDHVALLLQNGLHVAEIIHAIHRIRAVLILLNTRLTVNELLWQLADSEAVLLVYDESNTEKAAQIHHDHPSLHILSCAELAGYTPNPDVSFPSEINLNTLHSIMYTSGTTGHPKGVMLTYGNHWWSAIGSSLNLGLYETDRWLACVPLFHVSGLSILMRSVIYGTTVVIHETFDPKEANQAIFRKKITVMSVVSTMLARMISELEVSRYPDRFRCMLLGGGPAPKELLKKCKNFNIPVFQTYGLTETASQIVTLAPEDMLDKIGSAGKPLFPSECRIEKDGKEVDHGEVGEIVVHGPNVTSGYLKREKETNATIRDGWLYTGDLGFLDEEGFLYVLDRREDLIISGGENIYPAEVEAALLAYPDVADVGVIGIPDERWGQVSIAFVQGKRGAQINELDLLEDCRSRLANYKVPVKIYEVDRLPRNASGKLLRRKLGDLM